MKHFIFICALLTVSLIFASCSKSGNPTSTTTIDSTGNGGAVLDQILATIDGSNYIFGIGGASRTAIGGVPGIRITVPDSVNGKNLIIILNNISATGTYTLGSSSAQLTFGYPDEKGNTILYSTEIQSGATAGTITISVLSQNNIQGTFKGIIPLKTGVTGTSATINIAKGGFNLRFFA